jgi:hypothetical protein
MGACMSIVGRDHAMTFAGLSSTMRSLRDPLLLFAAPVVFALLLAFVGYRNSWPIGFDFRGTLWEPARAFLDGAAIYPEPTRDNVVTGNPAVYPPLFIIASVPLALLPVTAASWLWFFLLGACVFGAMRILGVGDWRCQVLAMTSPVTIHGLYYGNLTIVMVLLVSLGWRYRDRAPIGGLALGAAVAAKLFVWPLVVWLLLTRRFAAAAWAVGSAIVLTLGVWALIGFEGFRDYPKLLRVVQDVYAERSISISTVAGALGAPVSVALAVAALAGICCIGVAAWLVRQEDGDRRAFALLVGACVLASPIVWPNYAALVFVPIAITWPRLAPAWFFGYVIWLVGAIAPDAVAPNSGPPPPGVPEQAWIWSHSEPVFWFAAGLVVTVGFVAVYAGSVRRRPAAYSQKSVISG